MFLDPLDFIFLMASDAKESVNRAAKKANEQMKKETTRRANDVCKRYIHITDVMFREPAVIVKWSDGTKTVARCEENDTYSKEAGLSICIAKKFMGNQNFRSVFERYIYSDNAAAFEKPKKDVKPVKAESKSDEVGKNDPT